MSIIVEQPLPITILLLSRVSTYAHCVEVRRPAYPLALTLLTINPQSIVATFIIWVCPFLCPGMPPQAPRQLLKKQRTILCRTISVHSLNSSSTLVEEQVMQDNTAQDDQLESKSDQSTHRVSLSLIIFHVRS
jgi:hypothetical protein